MSYLYDLTTLFFPAFCAGCGQSLYRTERTLCLRCLAALPRTRIHDQYSNRIERLLWGRADLVSATAFLHMARHGLTHRLIHELKYRDNQNVGVELGALFGEELSKSGRMNHFDLIIPVPLHPKKRHLRGYNQCESIAEGISATMNIANDPHVLYRLAHTESQTRKTRFERWQNVHNLYGVRTPRHLEGKHILLIDDVITTGSTIEACWQVLQTISGCRLSVAALAMPDH